MENFRILLVEDDPEAALRVEAIIYHLGHQLIKTVDSSETALDWIDKSKPDIIVMDIKINGPNNGIEVAEKVADKPIPVIFITGVMDEELYNKAEHLSPVAFLVKPFNRLSLKAAINTAISQLNNRSLLLNSVKGNNTISKKDISLFIRRNNFYLKINIADIKYIQSEGNYCEFYSDKKHIIKISLVKVMAHLPSGKFIRIHHRYIVQLELIDKIDISASEIYVSDVVLPLGPRYKEKVFSMLNKL